MQEVENYKEVGIRYVVESRPIYYKVEENFDLLTSSYGITLSQEVRDDLACLMRAVDLVDSCLDNIDTAHYRLLFTLSLLEYLRDIEFQFPKEFPNSLVVALHSLRQVIHDNEIVEPFSLSLESIFLHTESKRSASKISDFLQHIKEEGLATAQLPLLIIGKIKNEAFTSMFIEMCQSMGVADLLMDARDDYKKGLNPFKPKLNLCTAILRDLIPSGIKLFWKFPQKLNLIKYLGRMIYFLVKG